MNAHRMDSETVERLLVGRDADPQHGPEALVRLLTAVRAAPRPTELVGERAALHAFRMARSGSPTVPAAPPRRRLLAGVLSAKVALAGLLVAGTGGVALAAVTGTLPGPLGGRTVPAPPPSASTDARPSPTGGPDLSAAPPSGTPGLPGAAPVLRQLCTEYRTQPGGERPRVLAAPRFAELVTAAGDRDGVDGYCDRLLDDRAQSGAPAEATPPGRSGGAPNSRVPSRPERIPTIPAVPATPSNPATAVIPGTPATTAHRPIGPAGQVQATVHPDTH
ncbi:hypothetical protein MRQ36_22465 [Micromonospora sp. R77]|uniref:hypothetical protein n=1 Tax=Micromonospora sp. R77 TaxID=2925836 RepID=UPI001F61C551|nr:hypothetical protein [Micromonospora sp. R77]MCI4065179.1 hypothetical protein [Micromonospora sp. R77]